MKRLVCALLLCVFIGFGCVPGPPDDPSMLCETMYDVGQCTDGSYPQACAAYDLSRCGFKVKGVMFWCAGCQPLVCDTAARDAVAYCYGYSRTEDMDKVDESVIDMEVEEFVYALEFLKETN